MQSHPEWVRGLKQSGNADSLLSAESHPEWVRGLKLLLLRILFNYQSVAPRVGAWIETEVIKNLQYGVDSRTPSGCVD